MMVGRSGQLSWVGTTKIIKESVNQTLYETRPFIHRILAFNPTHTHKQTNTERSKRKEYVCVCLCLCVCVRENYVLLGCVRERIMFVREREREIDIGLWWMGIMITEQSGNLREREGREGRLERSHVSTSDDTDARFKCKRERERVGLFLFCFFVLFCLFEDNHLDLGPTTDVHLLSFSYLLRLRILSLPLSL